MPDEIVITGKNIDIVGDIKSLYNIKEHGGFVSNVKGS